MPATDTKQAAEGSVSTAEPGLAVQRSPNDEAAFALLVSTLLFRVGDNHPFVHSYADPVGVFSVKRSTSVQTRHFGQSRMQTT